MCSGIWCSDSNAGHWSHPASVHHFFTAILSFVSRYVSQRKKLCLGGMVDHQIQSFAIHLVPLVRKKSIEPAVVGFFPVVCHHLGSRIAGSCHSVVPSKLLAFAQRCGQRQERSDTLASVVPFLGHGALFIERRGVKGWKVDSVSSAHCSLVEPTYFD